MHGKQMNYLATFGTFIAGLSVRLSTSTVLGKASLRSSQGEKSEKNSNACGRDYPADGLYWVRVCQRQAKIQSENHHRMPVQARGRGRVPPHRKKRKHLGTSQQRQPSIAIQTRRRDCDRHWRRLAPKTA